MPPPKISLYTFVYMIRDFVFGAAGKENAVQVTLILGECLANKARLNVLP